MWRQAYRSGFCVTGIASEKNKLYGVQFHPEVDLSENGRQMLRNFLFEVAKCKGSYTIKSREASCVQYIRDTVGDHKVLVSGLTYVIIIIMKQYLYNNNNMLSFSSFCTIFRI